MLCREVTDSLTTEFAKRGILEGNHGGNIDAPIVFRVGERRFEVSCEEFGPLAILTVRDVNSPDGCFLTPRWSVNDSLELRSFDGNASFNPLASNSVRTDNMPRRSSNFLQNNLEMLGQKLIDAVFESCKPREQKGDATL